MECIAMAVGFMMGAGCVLGALAVGKPSRSLRDSSPGGGAKGVASHSGRCGSEADGEGKREKLMKQWENFLNYDGTEKGQVSIEDGEE